MILLISFGINTIHYFLADGSPNLPNIQPLFITVDPTRDTIKLIKDYCLEFHHKLLGLTGSIEKIAEACKAYRVYYSSGPKDEDDDYIVSFIMQNISESVLQ